MPSHAHDPVQCRVGLPVPAAIEPEPTAGFARSGRDWADPAELGEGGFGTDPIGVVADGDQQLSGGVEPHPGAFQHVGCGSLGQGLEMYAMDLDLFVQIEPTQHVCQDFLTGCAANDLSLVA